MVERILMSGRIGQDGHIVGLAHSERNLNILKHKCCEKPNKRIKQLNLENLSDIVYFVFDYKPDTVFYLAA
tara:strand:+ start:2637 stop:2849 length:213 start_codon:yes stop_codon:yes gene_type:complete